tara:strand:- start:9785 stop:11227 length:1443 start_codon:yes stop_codon:yes gene_type:complete
MEKIKNYINGEFVAPQSGKYLDNFNPSNGKKYSMIPDSNDSDINNAVSSARDAFKIWKNVPTIDRSKILIQIADEIERQSEDLVKAESIDNGKPEWLAKKGDIPRAISNFKFFGTGILHFDSQIHDMDGEALNYTLRQPIGVVGCISPWNLPLYLLTWKIAPALAMGNTVVAKPSEITPMTAYLFSKICDKIGIPKGVINIVHGYGNKVGEALCNHPDVPVISFTGGTITGKKIASITAPHFKKLSLEMGGKNPNIIFEDAELDKAVEMTIKASFLNQGQICLCGSRLFVEKKIYKKFKNLFLDRTKKLKIGDPSNPKNDLGALVSKEHMEKVLSKINLAKEEGGKILYGGKRIRLKDNNTNGYFIEPTIIENLSNTCTTNQEEIFGPVVSMIPFKSEEEVVSMANSNRYGLSASIFTTNISKAHRMAAAIDAGIVWINTWMLRDLRIPFGGMKDSGIGREGGFNSLRFFSEPKNVCVKL